VEALELEEAEEIIEGGEGGGETGQIQKQISSVMIPIVKLMNMHPICRQFMILALR